MHEQPSRSPDAHPVGAGGIGALLPRGAEATATGLILPSSLTAAEWASAGDDIARVTSATQWWWGDWWAFGEHRYGTRAAMTLSAGWSGPGMRSLMDMATVCRAFETSRRREVLSFSHHREVASLPPEKADALLDWAEATIPDAGTPRSTRELRLERHRRQAAAVGAVADEDPPAVTEPLDVMSVIMRHSAAAASRPNAGLLAHLHTYPVAEALRHITEVDLEQFTRYVRPGDAEQLVQRARAARRQLYRLIRALAPSGGAHR